MDEIVASLELLRRRAERISVFRLIDGFIQQKKTDGVRFSHSFEDELKTFSTIEHL